VGSVRGGRVPGVTRVAATPAVSASSLASHGVYVVVGAGPPTYRRCCSDHGDPSDHRGPRPAVSEQTPMLFRNKRCFQAPRGLWDLIVWAQTARIRVVFVQFRNNRRPPEPQRVEITSFGPKRQHRLARNGIPAPRRADGMQFRHKRRPQRARQGTVSREAAETERPESPRSCPVDSNHKRPAPRETAVMRGPPLPVAAMSVATTADQQPGDSRNQRPTRPTTAHPQPPQQTSTPEPAGAEWTSLGVG